jgi:2'-5' RNA ligase
LRAAGLGVFPGPRRPRVVWTRVDEASGRLALLHRSTEAATAAFTSEKPEGAFTGHVTLARCKAIARGESVTLATLTGAMEKRSFRVWTDGAIEVVRSETESGGSRYTTLATISLD